MENPATVSEVMDYLTIHFNENKDSLNKMQTKLQEIMDFCEGTENLKIVQDYAD